MVRVAQMSGEHPRRQGGRSWHGRRAQAGCMAERHRGHTDICVARCFHTREMERWDERQQTISTPQQPAHRPKPLTELAIDVGGHEAVALVCMQA